MIRILYLVVLITVFDSSYCQVNENIKSVYLEYFYFGADTIFLDSLTLDITAKKADTNFDLGTLGGERIKMTVSWGYKKETPVGVGFVFSRYVDNKWKGFQTGYHRFRKNGKHNIFRTEAEVKWEKNPSSLMNDVGWKVIIVKTNTNKK